MSFRGERRHNETHCSTTDPEARLARKKGQTSHLADLGYLLTENRNGLIVSALVTEADGYAERLAALEMVEAVAGKRRITLGADKGFDTEEFITECRRRNVTPHVAQNTTNRATRIDGRTVRHEGYEISQRKRKRIEESFGWMKTIGLMRKTRHKGTNRAGWMFVFTAAVYNLGHMRNLVEVTGFDRFVPSAPGIVDPKDRASAPRGPQKPASSGMLAPLGAKRISILLGDTHSYDPPQQAEARRRQKPYP